MEWLKAITDNSEDGAFAAPIEAEEFAVLATSAGLSTCQGFAVAVSGGPDSMALAYVAHQYAIATSKRCIAFIVDHRLRPESTQEAEATRQRLDALGMAAEVLHWEHPPITTRLHVMARKARYALLVAACQRHGLTDLLLAHHREDQAETILMRFAKGSGIDGLAGIASVTSSNNVRLLRPLLNLSKERLVATCQAARLIYINDPSNQTIKYARGRLRRVSPLLEEEGFTTDRLIDLGERAREAKEALSYYTNAFLRVAVRMDQAGVIRLDLEQLRSTPHATAMRALTTCLQTIHHSDYPPERVTLVALLKALRSDAEMPARSLNGCLISKTATTATLLREQAAITDTQPINPGESIVWDQRWHVSLDVNTPEKNLVVRALGIQPASLIDSLAPRLRQLVPQGRARAALPALWRYGELVLIPALPSESNILASCHILNRIECN